MADQLIKKKKKKPRLLFQVGLIVFLVFSLLILTLGVLLIYNSRSSFFAGEEESMRVQIQQLHGIVSDAPLFEWVVDLWEKYPEEMKREMTETDYNESKYTEYVAGFFVGEVSKEKIAELKKLSINEQIDIAQLCAYSIGTKIMMSMPLTGDLAMLVDIRQGRTGMVFMMNPFQDHPMEMSGDTYIDLFQDEKIVNQLRASQNTGNKEPVFADQLSEGVYYYVGFLPVYVGGEPRFALAYLHDWTEYHDEQFRSILWMLGILLGILAIGGATLMLFISWATVGPVKRLRYGVRRYAKEKKPEILRNDMGEVKRTNELGDLADEISDMAEEIDRYMDENIRLAGEREAAKAELQLATRVQLEQLPETYPESPYFTMNAFIRPAREVGGDFYDYFLLDETHLMLLIADVSDKGMNAAFFMAISKAMIKAAAMKSRNPVEIVTEAESMLSENNPGGLFVTVWLAVIDLMTGHVEVCNAGHDYPAIRRNGSYTAEKSPHGPAVVFLPGVPHVGTSFDLEPGDRIFLYTDGVVEAMDQEGKCFGVPRLLEVLNAVSQDATDAELVEQVKTAVDIFVGEAAQFDDMTMLSFTYRR